MEWKIVSEPEDIEQIVQDSFKQTVLVYKHSPICGLSSQAKQKLEKGWENIQSLNLVPYYVDVISQRNLSRSIADRFGVVHQSPQVLLIEKGSCIYDTSHFSISVEELEKAVG